MLELLQGLQTVDFHNHILEKIKTIKARISIDISVRRRNRPKNMYKNALNFCIIDKNT